MALRSPGTGKTRFVSVGPDDRAHLAVAMALDAVAVLRDVVARVIIVCGPLELDVARRLGSLGAELRDEPTPPRGLNAALADGIAALPGDTPTIACVGDLPSLDADSVRAVLDESRTGPVAVPDADGLGTTMIAGAARLLEPRFGGHSAARHRAHGYRLLPGAPERARRDVDDATALLDAVRVGVGPATARLLSDASWWTQQVPAGDPAGTC